MTSATGSGALAHRLDEGPLLADGAMGTMLYARGVAARRLLRRPEPQRPEDRPVDPREYVAAGADLHRDQHVRRQPLQARRPRLDGRVREINRAGARLARDVRETMGRDVLVLGSIGPLGQVPPAPRHARARPRRAPRSASRPRGCSRAAWTDSSPRPSRTSSELRLAVEAIRAVSADLPDRGPDGVQRRARHLPRAGAGRGRARRCAALPVQVIGANCGVGSSVLYDVGAAAATRRRPRPGCRSSRTPACRAGTASG